MHLGNPDCPISGHCKYRDEISEIIEFNMGHTCVIQEAFEQKLIM